MQIRSFIPIVAVLSTWTASTNAVNLAWSTACYDLANKQCPEGSKRFIDAPWTQHWTACMQDFWAQHSTDTKCPYTDVDCRAYNGCVADRWDIYKDVGRQCRDQCKLIPRFMGCK
ncbi:hypothetical protein V8E36_002109 [Tilletia maclaganii]